MARGAKKSFRWQPQPRQFEAQVCDHMVAIHHAHKRTDIQRNDKNQRGYARVSLRDASDFVPSPAPAQQDALPF